MINSSSATIALINRLRELGKIIILPHKLGGLSDGDVYVTPFDEVMMRRKNLYGKNGIWSDFHRGHSVAYFHNYLRKRYPH